MFRDGAWCNLIKSRRDKDCPCRICLIKVMCRYSCEEYRRYAGASKQKGYTKRIIT
jgi:hypothetical protein